jgi:carboxyl-terminal processing protease
VEPSSELRRATVAQIVDLVERYYYDRAAAAAWAQEHRHYAEITSTTDSMYQEIRRRLSRLQASHTELYSSDHPGYPHILAIFEHVLQLPSDYDSVGIEMAQLNGDWFATYVFPGGPAERGGILRGDRLLRADGGSFHPVLSFRGRSGESVSVIFQRNAEGPLNDTAVTPRRISPVEEWRQLQKRSTAVLNVQGCQVGYCMLWCCAGEEPERILHAALSSTLAGARGLVIDFRGGWGGCNLSLLEVLEPVKRGRNRSLILLVDRRTRSGKEIVTRMVQKHKWGTIVGERTAGAVMRGMPFALQDGSILYLAVEDVALEGERIEGNGIEPDISVPSDPRYCAGRDLPRETALALAFSH